MKNRLLLSITLLTLMAFTFACGGAATNVNNSNAMKNTNMAPNMNTASNMSTNTTSNMATNMASNMAANKTSNMAANSAANKMTPPAANTVKESKPPKGATAKCKDGTYSFSKTDSGQCSGHGGVDKKF